jgi:phosphoribosylformylglycinamidine synthase
VIQVRHTETDDVLQILDYHGLAEYSPVIGMLDDSDQIRVCRRCRPLFEASRIELQAGLVRDQLSDAVIA